ncbi:hypothetical protein AKJ16_DCAP03465 [Drosera capensis]
MGLGLLLGLKPNQNPKSYPSLLLLPHASASFSSHTKPPPSATPQTPQPVPATATEEERRSSLISCMRRTTFVIANGKVQKDSRFAIEYDTFLNDISVVHDPKELMYLHIHLIFLIDLELMYYYLWFAQLHGKHHCCKAVFSEKGFGA